MPAVAPPGPPGPRWLSLSAALSRTSVLSTITVLALGIVVFGQALHFGFVTADDRSLIVNNQLVTAWWQQGFAERFFTTSFGYAIPATVASFAADFALFDGSAAGFHLTNLLLHLACVLLTLAIARRLLAAPAALVVALIVLLHPVQVEAVAFITQRKDLLVTVFALLSLLLVLTARPGPRSAGRLSLVCLCLILSNLAKPSALLLPVVLALVLVARQAGTGGTRDRRGVGVLLLLAPLFYALQTYVDQAARLSVDHSQLLARERLAIVVNGLSHYLSALLGTVQLAPKVPRSLELHLWPCLLLVLVVAAVLVGLVRAARRSDQPLLLSLLWFIGAYLPVANLVPLQRFAADSYLYLAMPALAMLIGLGWQRLYHSVQQRHRSLRITMASLTAVVLLGLGVLSFRQTSVWRNDETLFSYLFRLYPASRDAVTEYVELLAEQGRIAEARAVEERYLRQALAARPEDWAARRSLLQLCLRFHDRPCAGAVLEAIPGGLREQPGYFEALLDWALYRRDRAAALAAVREILHRYPASPRRTILLELERQLQPPPSRSSAASPTPGDQQPAAAQKHGSQGQHR